MAKIEIGAEDDKVTLRIIQGNGCYGIFRLPPDAADQLAHALQRNAAQVRDECPALQPRAAPGDIEKLFGKMKEIFGG